MKPSEIRIINEYTERTGWYADWCEGCQAWTVHCPECGFSSCAGCDWGYTESMKRQQKKLDELLGLS